jgi:NAD+ kinase
MSDLLKHRLIGLVIKPGGQEAIAILDKLLSMAPAGVRFVMEAEGYHALAEMPVEIERLEREVFERDVDMVVVLGGDGTLIHAASLLQNRCVPILGINLGTIGFMTEVRAEEVDDAFAQALRDALPRSERMRLEVELWRGGEVIGSRRILNDAVITQNRMARIASFAVSYNREEITVVRGDGVMVSTPTGSTGYALAAGGSILYPELEAMAVTPICPHQLTQRPLVLSSEGEVEIRVVSDSAVFVTLDGQAGLAFDQHDSLRIRRSAVPVILYEAPWRSYFKTLRCKLNWGQALPGADVSCA